MPRAWIVHPPARPNGSNRLEKDQIMASYIGSTDVWVQMTGINLIVWLISIYEKGNANRDLMNFGRPGRMTHHLILTQVQSFLLDRPHRRKYGDAWLNKSVDFRNGSIRESPTSRLLKHWKMTNFNPKRKQGNSVQGAQVHETRVQEA